MEYLLGIWEAIKKAIVGRPAPFLVFQDSNAIVRALRDHLANDVGEIIVDDTPTHEEARQFMERAMPQNLRKLRLYEDSVPLFTRFQIESQIESAFSHTVTLPSGGSLVIEQTEALVSIDINSARATKGEDIEATAFATNLEAAEEVARQCRLRDLGGLLVVDFIDMASQRNQRDVENRLRDAMKMDRARVQIGRISRFGLLELSRQRLRPSLGESAHQTCPRCNGSGSIRGVESLALAVLRLIGEEARKDRSSKVIAQLPVDVATYLLNEKRDWIRAIEERDKVQLILVANPALETPNYTLRRVRDDQVTSPENVGASYALASQEQPPSEAALDLFAPRVKPEEPAVVPTMPATPAPPPPPEFVDAATSRPAAPVARTAAGPGLFARLFRWLSGGSETGEAREQRQPEQGGRRDQQGARHGHDGGRHRGQHGRGRRDERHRDDRQRGHRGGEQREQRDHREQREQRDFRDNRGPRPPRPEGGRGGDRSGGRHESRRPSDEMNRQGGNGEQRSAQGGDNGPHGGHAQGEQGGRRRERSRSRRRGRGGGENRPPRDDQSPVAQAGEREHQVSDSSSALNTPASHERPSPAPREERAFERESPAPREMERAAEPAKPAPSDTPTTPPPSSQWQPPAPGPSKTYTVWSSGPAESSDQGDRDPGV